ncbi:sodium:alanine symporter family protein [Romboutsia sp. CE17]|uniref:alanine/glycine:cation symporter family protein n=1 Tax=Romboutsia sp. CE17 TaxID=2724150 RepID=UPI001442B53D|nr:sodium:alanine symporter family protein [Romboutsia sp. CE17]QJA08155.1 sodium:alanine symporter family protein [Romboutsia sp. CE17]
MLENIIIALADFLWGFPTMILIFVTGLVFSIKTGFFQIRCLPYVLKETLGSIFKKDKILKSEGVMTPFQAVATALSGTVGTANIAGIATAIAIGGPGSVFWMWFVAMLGMITKMVEVSLAVYYREKDKDGNFYGGPMYYIEKGLGDKWRLLAKFFAVMMILGALGTAVFVQPHTMSQAMNNIFNIPPVATVLIVTAITGIVVIGGFKRIGQFCEKITPAMCILYIVASLGVIIINIENLPTVISNIFVYAFQPMPAIGGFAGSTVLLTLRRGMSRGIFSNEAGMGSAPMVHATAITDHPIRQGLYGVFEVFVDTLVVGSCTSLAILCCGPEVWASGLNGVDLTIAAFSSVYGGFGSYIIGICVLLFALSTMIGWAIEYETSVVYVFGNKYIKLFRWIYLIPPFLTLGKTTEMIWTVVDVATGIEIIPNLIAVFMLSGVFTKLFKDFTLNHMYDKSKVQ